MAVDAYLDRRLRDLEKQVTKLQAAVDTLKRQIEAHAREIEGLKKDSHPPADIIHCVTNAMLIGELDDEVRHILERFQLLTITKD